MLEIWLYKYMGKRTSWVSNVLVIYDQASLNVLNFYRAIIAREILNNLFPQKSQVRLVGLKRQHFSFTPLLIPRTRVRSSLDSVSMARARRFGPILQGLRKWLQIPCLVRFLLD